MPTSSLKLGAYVLTGALIISLSINYFFHRSSNSNLDLIDSSRPAVELMGGQALNLAASERVDTSLPTQSPATKKPLILITPEHQALEESYRLIKADLAIADDRLDVINSAEAARKLLNSKGIATRPPEVTAARNPVADELQSRLDKLKPEMN